MCIVTVLKQVRKATDRRLVVVVSEPMHRQLKTLAARRSTTVRSIVVNFIQYGLAVGKDQPLNLPPAA